MKIRWNRVLIIGLLLVIVAGLGTFAVVRSRAAHGPRAQPVANAAADHSAHAFPAGPKTLKSSKSGNWSDPAVWGGQVPGRRTVVTIVDRTTVTTDADVAQVAGVDVRAGGTLAFNPGRSTTVQSTGNVVVGGGLAMRPASPSVVQTLRFTGVNERSFVGGGMDVLGSDVGLWVMGAGKLDAQGAQKSGWLNAAGAVDRGATTVRLASAPTGWQVGDEISIAPTEKPAGNDHHDPAYNDFDEGTVAAIAGDTITLKAPAAHAHPQVNRSWTAEVMNLTRNVRIEGTQKGHSHVFIHSSARQNVNYVGIRYMGPRKDADHDGITDLVGGRYGLHFHMNRDATRGTVVQGVVVRDTPNHAFVPHQSNGITFRDDISYNTTEDAYWWDQAPSAGADIPEPMDFYATSGTVYDHDIAARIYAIPDYQGYGLTGFNLSGGADNSITNSVVVGNLGGTTATGFGWPEAANPQPNAWTFRSNIAHNNVEDGASVWQNTDYGPHLTDNLVAYRNGHCGIRHGAYINSYIYRRPVLFENLTCGILPDAQSGSLTSPITFDHPTIIGGKNAVLDTDHNGNPPEATVYLRDCTISGQTGAKVEVNTSLDPQRLAFVRCGIEPRDIHLTKAVKGDRILSQRADNSAFEVDHQGKARSTPRFDSQPPWSPPGANRPPTVKVLSPVPATHFTFSGDWSDTTFIAEASDPDGRVREVQFFVEGRRVGTDNTAPYRVPIELRSYMNGPNIVSAIAVDDQGVPSYSNPVEVQINEASQRP